MTYYNEDGYAEYVPVDKKLRKARKYAANLHGKKVNPIVLERRTIAATFWGQAWCDNLERYAKLTNRLERGKTYVRNGSVVHIEIKEGRVKSIVAGSEPYCVEIKITPLSKTRWKEMKKKCSGGIGTVVELLQGKLSKNVLSLITNQKDGLFPSPRDIQFGCSCPDGFGGGWMCKHVAATLYGIGSLLDKSPELFFKLSGVDYLELIDTAVSIPAAAKDSDTLEDSALSEIFGIEFGGTDEKSPPKKKTDKKKSVKKSVKKAVKKVTKKARRKVTVKRAVKNKYDTQTTNTKKPGK